MMKSLEKFTVDSNGHCLICLVKPKSDGRKFPPSGSNSVCSLQELSHYLNLDLGKPFRANGGHQLLPNFGLKATLCEECASIHQKIINLNLQLDQVEVEMGSWLKLIRWKFLEADDAGQKEFNRKMRWSGSEHFEIVENLRKETLKKCCLKLSPASSDEVMMTMDWQGTPKTMTMVTQRSPPCSVRVDKYRTNRFGQCLICLVKLNREWVHPSLSSHSMIYLKKLTQYLKIDLDLTNFPIGFKLSMCQECVPIHQEFGKLYQQKVKIEMEMATWLKLFQGKLYNVDKACQAEFMSSEGWNGRGQLNLVGDVRKEVLEKCSLKLDSFSVSVTVTEEITSEAIGDNMKAVTNQISDATPSHKSYNFPATTKGKNLPKCDVCEKEFYHQSSLAAHRLTHVSEVRTNDKPHNVTSLKMETNHNSILNVSCRRCKIGFRQSSDFRNHFKLFHEDIRQVECDICHKKLKSPQDLVSHQKAKHPPRDPQAPTEHTIDEWWDEDTAENTAEECWE